jgi:methyltransferase-like protein/2-polyprenyl-3-methyl-5-hydroxy-6-metoxy-1,4-benzoquinol methylase
MEPAVVTSTYDIVPYESHPFPQSHPDRLAVLGRIFGLNPAPVTKCRVLELGAASGGNIIPSALLLPASEFVGVDYSARQVEDGRQTIAALGLANVSLRHASITDIDSSWGLFDYIICHGVYSWVPPTVKEGILRVARENLAPEGVAYISYNTYPGWHWREMIRRMMLYHGEQFAEIPKKVEQARALIEFLAKAVPTENNPYGLFLKSELEIIKRSKDYYLVHDHLEEVNTPVYFHEFCEAAGRQGLQYLAEAEFGTMLASGFPAEVAETLKRISPDIVKTEQYMDFLRNRFFRQTLLCHREAKLTRHVGPDNVKNFLVDSAADGQTKPIDLAPETRVRFQTPAGASVDTNHPLTKAALVVLREAWPQAVGPDELVRLACEKSGVTGYHHEQMKLILAGALLSCYSARVVEFHTWQADFTPKVSDQPRASRLARHQASQGQGIVVNCRHETTPVDAVGQQLLVLLDGTRGRAELLEELRQLVKRGVLQVNQDGKPVTNQVIIDYSLRQAMEAGLAKMAAAALLIG